MKEALFSKIVCLEVFNEEIWKFLAEPGDLHTEEHHVMHTIHQSLSPGMYKRDVEDSIEQSRG